MSLLVYNLTAAPLVLANGLFTTIPASTAGAGVRGEPWYASGNELNGRSAPEYLALQAQANPSAGVGDSLAVAGVNVTLTDAAGAFIANNIGQSITIANATSPANNGVFLVTAQTATTITFTNPAGVAEVFAGTYSLPGLVAFEWQEYPEYNTYPLLVASVPSEFGELDEIIYVDVAGNDANPGTAALPLLTMKAAFAKLPAIWKRSMVVQFGLGTFPTNGIKTTLIGSGLGPDATPLQILGQPLDTGLGVLTALGTSTATTYVAAVVTVLDDQRGAYLRNTTTGGRALITGNTPNTPNPGETTFNVIGDGLSVAALDTFIIERPGTVFDVGPTDVWDVGHGTGEIGFGMRDIKFFGVGGGPGAPLAALFGFLFFEAVEFDGGPDGRTVLGNHGSRWNAASETIPWVSAPVNPFNSSLRSLAGLYVHTNGFAMGFGLGDRCSFSVRGLVLDRVVLFYQDFVSTSIGAISGRVVSIFLDNHIVFGLDQGKIDGDFGFGAGAIQAADYVEAILGFSGNGLEISNAVGHGVSAVGVSNIITSNLTGTGNGGHGLSVNDASLVRVNRNGGTTDITGTAPGSDVLVGAVTKAYGALPYGEVDGSGPTGNRAQ